MAPPASFDEEDEAFWGEELASDDGAPPSTSTDTDTPTPTPPGTGPTCGAIAAAPIQSSITQFFGGGWKTPTRSCSRVLSTNSTAPSSTPRRGPAAGQSTSATTEAGRRIGSQSPDAVVPTNCENDSEFLLLTNEEKDKVHSSTSLVWQYFKKINKDLAKCNSCGSEAKTPTGSTTLLTRHLSKVHLNLYSEYCRLQKIKTRLALDRARKRKSNVPKLKRLVNFPLDSKGKRSKEITRAIAVFMAKGLKPYSVVEEVGFLALVNVLEPRYMVPSRSQFSRTIIPTMYEDGKRKLQERLQELCDNESLESVSITIDGWSSRKLDAFLAFTLQFINPDWAMEKHTLDLDPFPGAHTADAICERMDDKLSEYFLNSRHVKKYVTSDNGSNMLAALEQPKEERILDEEIAEILRHKKAWEHFKCFNHTGQLAINDTKKDMNMISVIEKLSKLVQRYSKSRTAKESFEKFQSELKLPGHGLLQRVKTRWNSDFIMMERAVEQKQAIVAECTAAGEDHLTTQEWKLAEGFVEVLRPLAEHTNEMGSEQKPTASMILPTIFEITSDLKDFIRSAPRGTGIQFARKILSNLESRFEYYRDNETIKVATLVDPRYKNILEDQSWIQSAQEILENEAAEKYRVRIRRGLEVPTTPTRTALHSPTSEPAAKKGRWRHLQQKTAVRTTHTNEESSKKIQDEVKSYLLLPTIEVEEDPLAWWKANHTSFPNLALVAKQYLAIAGTEVSSERVASSGSNVVTPKRTNLATEHVKELVFLHDNLEIPGFY
ncbi:zinc finger BED domain-containing protein 4 [Thrips palmi]|uniref:Zinc finger BED domain-containing protein 4 n=1 Tax=Thrips palmi TaxID=161013 RepID=A0A6P8YMM4_THRPL|nr:zinc finger BED domain-containing protein 4 [Thrips palmi]